MPFEGYKRRDENSGYLQAGVVPKTTENSDGTLTQHVNVDSVPTGHSRISSMPTGSVIVTNFPSSYSVNVLSMPTGSLFVSLHENGVVSTLNSSTAPLGSGGAFSGTYENVFTTAKAVSV